MRKALIALVVAMCATMGCTPDRAPGQPGQSLSAQSQAEAYFALLRALYTQDDALNANATYLALDLSQARLSDTAPLEALVRDFCAEHGYTLLLDTMEGLEAKGYITDLHFENGFVIGFVDVSLTDNELVTRANKWRSGLGAIGGEYTVTRGPTGWTITAVTSQWIS